LFKYIIKRLLQAIPLLIGVSIIAFSIMHLAPGGPLSVYTLNPSITAQDIDKIKATHSYSIRKMGRGYVYRKLGNDFFWRQTCI